MQEVWRPIPDYEGLYEVSNLGNVRSLGKTWETQPEHQITMKPRILKQERMHCGYMLVTLCKHGKTKTFRVHRLVAHAFCQNPLNKPYVNHINGKKDDNKAINLEWCTPKENTKHSFEVLGRKAHSKPIICIETGIIYESAFEAERATGVNRCHISSVCRGKRKHSGGFTWRFVNEG